MPKATGVDYSSKNKIRDLQAEGYTAEEISSMVQVVEKSVQSWMDYFVPPEPKPKPKTKAKKKSEDETED